MNRIFLYFAIIVLLLICISFLNIKSKENYEKDRPAGPWGDIGTGKPWYMYPYILHNIEYY
jgi:hypothetical protein